ncbi:HD domain-containing protein [Thalassotalea aquiviva]|uniref:HD domain-containing protein n=1 Tax=Thalassotalea aquiviva TaxID=3242415 RepID=UPI00352B69CF
MFNNSVESQLYDFISQEMKQDLAHDLNHVLRVVKTAKHLCQQERSEPLVVIPSAYLHDCFSFSKNHPSKHLSSLNAADKAIRFLESIHYPRQYLPEIHHAIVAHSYSANVEAKTLEAKIVQDADRLDALGAIGIARCIQVSVKLNRPLYSVQDPFCDSRDPDDAQYTIDHFFTKLLKLPALMHTRAGKKEAKKRADWMKMYLAQLQVEVEPS